MLPAHFFPSFFGQVADVAAFRHFQGTTSTLSLSVSAHYRLGVSSALPLAPLPQDFLLVENSLYLEGLQACLLAPSRAANFDLSLCTIQAQGTQESAFRTSLSKKHSGETFGRQKVRVIDMCPTWENIPWYHTPFIFLLRAISKDLLQLLQLLTLQETETAWPVLLLVLSVALWIFFARLQGMFSPAEMLSSNRRMHEPAPGYTCTLC